MSPRTAKRKELRDLIKKMRERQFVVEDRTGRKHLKLQVQCPNGCSFLWILASTPSDSREWPNATATLRRSLEACGYGDEREFLRISTGDDTRKAANEIHALIDKLEKALLEPFDDEP